MDFVHRDLKPENIGINLKPLQAWIIDFDRAKPRQLSTEGTMLGTPGYYPNFINLRDGSTRWDVWAVAAIILESDMEPGVYRTVSNERGSQIKAE